MYVSIHFMMKLCFQCFRLMKFLVYLHLKLGNASMSNCNTILDTSLQLMPCLFLDYYAVNIGDIFLFEFLGF